METELFAQLGLSLTAVILASNTLTNLFKFIVPREHSLRSELVRLLNFGFTILITALLISAMEIESVEVAVIFVTIIGALGAERVYESNSSSEEERYDEDF